MAKFSEIEEKCISHEKFEQYGLDKPETIGEFIG